MIWKVAGRGACRCVVLEAPRPSESAVMNNYVIPPYHRSFSPRIRSGRLWKMLVAARDLGDYDSHRWR